jgi:hypothetical protein
MKKIIIVAMLLVLGAASMSFAASARWNALGAEHRFMLDTSNYAMYLGRMHMFADALWIIPSAPYGNNDMASGLLVKQGDMAWAIHYNLPGTIGFPALRTALNDAGGNLGVGGLVDNLRPFPDLFLAKKVGDMTVGGRLVIGIASSEPVADKTASAMSVDAGLGATMPIGSGDLDVGARVSMASFSDDSPAQKIESTGGIGVNGDARLMMDIGGGTKVIPVLGVSYTTDPVVDGADEVTTIGVNVGCGLNKTDANKCMLVTGAVLDIEMKTTSPVAGDDVVVTTTAFTYLGGYEKPLNSWLIARGGARGTLTMVSGDVAAQMDTDFYYNFGIRAMYKKALLDVLLNRSLFHRGPHIISGQPGNLGTNVCLTYLLF